MADKNLINIDHFYMKKLTFSVYMLHEGANKFWTTAQSKSKHFKQLSFLCQPLFRAIAL
jgi:hypothetical protein